MGDMTPQEKKEFNEKFEKLLEQQLEMKAEIKSVVSILNNDKYTDRPGLVREFSDIKTRVNNLEINERLLKQRISTTAGIAAFFGMLFAWVVDMTYNFFFRN